MGIKFQSLVFFIGILISSISLWTLNGCGRSFQMALFWILAYSWPQVGRGSFLINILFHGIFLVLATWLLDVGLRRIMDPARSKFASAAVALLLYCLLLFVLFPMQECAI
jgi:hypothetical protein